MRYQVVHLTAVIAALLVPLVLAAVTIPKIPDLQTMQWNHRVILLFAPSPGDALLAQQKAQLDADPKGLDERNVRVFEITGDSQAAASLRSHFDVQADRFAIVLVGKDGGRKLKKNEPVELSALFNKIDAMPMRRDEMKHSGAR